MYAVTLSHAARKSLKKYVRNGRLKISTFNQSIHFLVSGIALPASFKEHQLKGNLSGYREYHLTFDLLVIYERNVENRTITIVNIGTHQSLF